MLEPLQQWICDHCHEVIALPEDGYIIWGRNDVQKSGYRIVHQTKCDDKNFPCSTALADYLGPDGLSNMLSSLSPGPIKNAQGDHSDNSVDLDSYVDLIRRLHVPYYEEARRHFGDQNLKYEKADSSEFAPYRVEELQETIARYGAEN